MGSRLTQDTRVQYSFDDTASSIHHTSGFKTRLMTRRALFISPCSKGEALFHELADTQARAAGLTSPDAVAAKEKLAKVKQSRGKFAEATLLLVGPGRFYTPHRPTHCDTSSLE
jgi:hypothetical protein